MAIHYKNYPEHREGWIGGRWAWDLFNDLALYDKPLCYAVWCCCNTVNFLTNIHKRHPIAHLLTHWGRVMHICIGKLIIIGSDNGLSPDRRQAIIWTNAELLSIGPLRTYFSENLIKMQQFSLKKMHVKMSSAKWRLFCLGLNVLRQGKGCIFWILNLIDILPQCLWLCM